MNRERDVELREEIARIVDPQAFVRSEVWPLGQHAARETADRILALPALSQGLSAGGGEEGNSSSRSQPCEAGPLPRQDFDVEPSGAGWRCFQCDERFSSARDAALHFTHSPLQPPACVRQLTHTEKQVHDQIARLEGHAHYLYLIKTELEAALQNAAGATAVSAAYAAARATLETQPAAVLALSSEEPLGSPSETSASGSPRDGLALSEDILFYAFRYALGRMTYAVEHVAEALIANAPRLSPRLRDLVLKEIDACPSLGMEADRRPWRRVYDAFLALVGGEAVDLDASFADQSTVPRNDQIQSSQALKGELVEALKAIQLRAFGDGTRTFDDCMKSLQWIDDHARLALTKASDTPSQAERS